MPPKDARPKTLKIGFLILIKKQLTGWKMNNRFCILTNANELEWYKKQEDQVDHKPAGAFKKLETCEIEETEDLNGTEWCFSIKSGGKTNYFGATSDQDRMNWMVEILKLRQPAEIISMFDHPKLSKHAAFALANLCGSKDHVVNIVKIGGTQALVGFLDKLNPAVDTKLIDSVYLVLIKLCEREETKAELGQLFQMMFDLFAKSKEEKHQDFVTQAISHCCTLDENRTRLASHGGIKWLVDHLDKDIGEKAKLNITETITRLSQNDQVRASIRDGYLDRIILSLGKAKDTVKVGVIQLLMNLATRDATIVEKLKKVTLVPSIVSFLVSNYGPLQESSSTFISFLMTNDDNEHKHKSELKAHNGLQNLISSLSAPSDRVKDKSLAAIATFVSSNEENAIEFSNQGEAIIPILNLIAAPVESLPTPPPEKKSSDKPEEVKHEEKVDKRSITASALKIMKTLSVNQESRAQVTKSAKTIVALLEGYVRLKDDFLEEKVVSLANYSTVDRVKIEICKSTLLSILVDSVTTDSKGLLPTLITISNCSTLAYAKIAIGRLSGFNNICAIIKSSTDDVLRYHAASIVANCIVEVDNTNLFRDQGGVVGLITALSSSKEDLQSQAARALSIVAFYDETDVIVENNGVKALLGLLTSPNGTVREYAAKALRNLSVSDKAKMEIYQQGGTKPLLDTLEFPNTKLQEHAALALRNTISKEGVPNDVIKLHGVKPLLGLLTGDQADIKVIENALWVLSYCHTQIQDRIVILKVGGIPSLLSCVEFRNERVKEVASLLVSQCLIRPQKQTELVPRALQKMYSLLSLPNPKVVENILSIIYAASKNPKMKPLVAEGARKLIPFLRSSNQKVRHYASGALINSALSAENEVELKSIGGLSAILNLPDIQLRHNNAWKLKLATFDNPDARKIEISVTKQPAATITFQTKSQLKYRLAKCLACCYYGQDYRPEEEDFKPKQEEEPKDKKKEEKDESFEQAPPAEEEKSGGAVSKVKDAFNKPVSPASSASPPLNRAPSKKAFAPASTQPPSQTTASRSGSQRPINQQQFLGIKRKEQVPTLTRSEKVKVKFTYEQMEAIAFYRSLSNPVLAQYYESILGYFRESYLKAGEEKENLRARDVNLIAGPGVFIEDNYIVRYDNGDMNVPALVRSTKPINPTVTWAYFEVYVIATNGPKATVAIGLANEDYPLDQQPGWQSGSYGYHGDDGNKFFDSQHDSYGPRFTVGDVVGCGYNNITKEIFYTKNGFLVGTAFENAPSNLFAVVGLASPGERVYVNFGQNPFVFDFSFKNYTSCPIAPKAEVGQELPFDPIPKVLSGEIGEVFEGFASYWFFLHPERERAESIDAGKESESRPRIGSIPGAEGVAVPDN
eukprot:TRINITY_DN2040_c0_g4_i2.p1 TRINITY_DN2040_c0_g4~~TRINITY_DN2040_c0_g4_i2.p1  ORF type:complete len:1372 (-),score=296.41 TRINITY_DN2040_c0_g4_i2:256-4371(-)